MERTASEREAALDAAVLHDAGWFPGATECASGGAAGQGFAMLDIRTPLQELIEKETPEEREAMLEGAILVIREAIGPAAHRQAPDVVGIGATIALWAMDAGLEPFASMSQRELADLVAQTRAAICARQKRVVQRKKEANGGRAVLTKGQKSLSLVEVYREGARGNRNRSGAKRRERAKRVLKAPEGLAKETMPDAERLEGAVIGGE